MLRVTPSSMTATKISCLSKMEVRVPQHLGAAGLTCEPFSTETDLSFHALSPIQNRKRACLEIWQRLPMVVELLSISVVEASDSVLANP